MKNDAGHAAVIETEPGQMLSSHAVKRFFMAFRQHHLPKFRELLHHWFIAELCAEKPAAIILGLDSVVLDNDETLKREGVHPTYRKVKGFEPLQLSWRRQVVAVQFRSGSRHSNHGEDPFSMIQRAVRAIRASYREDVPIIVRMDDGFKDFGFEQLPFHRFVANAAFYYVMMLSFVLFELFKQRVCAPVIPVTAYASSLRRRLIDMAAKIVRHGGRVIFKVPRAVNEHLNFERLWQNTAAVG